MDESGGAPLAEDEPGLADLVGQLRDDAHVFVEAEAQYIKAAARERVFYATPGLAMIVAAGSLGAGALVALLFGLMMVIAPIIGQGWATMVIFTVAAGLSALLGWAGTRRIRNAFKKPEDR